MLIWHHVCIYMYIQYVKHTHTDTHMNGPCIQFDAIVSGTKWGSLGDFGVCYTFSTTAPQLPFKKWVSALKLVSTLSYETVRNPSVVLIVISTTGIPNYIWIIYSTTSSFCYLGLYFRTISSLLLCKLWIKSFHLNKFQINHAWHNYLQYPNGCPGHLDGPTLTITCLHSVFCTNQTPKGNAVKQLSRNTAGLVQMESAGWAMHHAPWPPSQRSVWGKADQYRMWPLTGAHLMGLCWTPGGTSPQSIASRLWPSQHIATTKGISPEDDLSCEVWP